MSRPNDFDIWSIRLSDVATIRRNMSILSDIEPTHLLRLANKEIHVLELILFLVDFCAESNLHGSVVFKAILSTQQVERMKLQLTLMKQDAGPALKKEIEYLLDEL